MSEARVNNLSNESNTGGPTISGISTFSGTNFFVPPVGTTAQRPENPQKGALRFNTDTKHLEYYKGDTLGWTEIEASHGQLGGGTGSNLGSGARGLFAGGNTPGLSDVVDYITISTFGDAIDFGNLNAGKQRMGVTSDSTRLVTGAGYTTTFEVEMDYFTISSTGDYADFGDLTLARTNAGSAASTTRGVVFGGTNQTSPSPRYNTIDYVTIDSIGNATDFGDLQVAANSPYGNSNLIRGVYAVGEEHPPGSTVQQYDYITIATTGNASTFGDMANRKANPHAMSSDVDDRGCWGGGYLISPGATTNAIEYVTISSTGNGTDFGDLTTSVYRGAGCAQGTG